MSPLINATGNSLKKQEQALLRVLAKFDQNYSSELSGDSSYDAPDLVKEFSSLKKEDAVTKLAEIRKKLAANLKYPVTDDEEAIIVGILQQQRKDKIDGLPAGQVAFNHGVPIFSETGLWEEFEKMTGTTFEKAAKRSIFVRITAHQDGLEIPRNPAPVASRASNRR